MYHELAIHVQAHNPLFNDPMSSSLALFGDYTELRVHLGLFSKKSYCAMYFLKA